MLQRSSVVLAAVVGFAVVAAVADAALSAEQRALQADLERAKAEVARIEARLASDAGRGSSRGATRSTEEWMSVRSQLVSTIFGTNGTLPSRAAPDYIENIPGPQANGCYCAYFGHCDASDCQWGNNMTKLTWTITAKVNETYTLSLNSTVFHTLNTSGVAPQIYPPVGPVSMPDGGWYGNASKSSPAHYATARQKTLVIFHHGHSQPCDQCWVPWIDQTMDYVNQLGMDAMILQMPLHQCNYVPESGCNHEWFKQFADQGVHFMRYFLEPSVLTINYAKSLGYERIVFFGLSGGGWTTTLMGAIDPRIQLSMPIAGSVPCDFVHTSWDFEQFCTNDWAQVCNYTCLYTLAGLEANRYSVQILHEQDPCCFHGADRHTRIQAYNAAVQAEIQGHFETVITVGNVHEVNVRDKVVVAGLVDNLRRNGELTPENFESIPFNTLREWGP